jgi:hypothetical protein
MKQGKASSSGVRGTKVEPTTKALNPGGVANMGNAIGNHATDTGTFRPQPTPLNAGRGFTSPGIGNKRHRGGSQGKY